MKPSSKIKQEFVSAVTYVGEEPKHSREGLGKDLHAVFI